MIPAALRSAIGLRRKVVRRLNHAGLFFGGNGPTTALVTGHTRSGTTWIADLLCACLGYRMVHEPLCVTIRTGPRHIRDRDSRRHVSGSPECMRELRAILCEAYRGCRATNHGWRIAYRGRLVKLVRACFYPDLVLEACPGSRMVSVMRHPCACVSSRLSLGWDVPDMTSCIEDLDGSLTRGQRACLDVTAPPHARMAAAWCLDNLATAMRTEGDRRVMTVRFEDVVRDPVGRIGAILDHLAPGHCVGGRRIERENCLLRDPGSFDPERIVTGWRSRLTREQVQEIMAVADEYGLGGLYPAEGPVG